MKHIKSLMAAALTIAAGAITSCTDKMDNWDSDSSFARVFAVTSLKATPEATTALIEYGGNNTASSYQIEYSTSLDALRASDEPGADGTTTVESTSKSSVTLTDLISETDYYLRVRAIAPGKTSSRWMYLIKDEETGVSFTTKGEQIMNAVTSSDITENSIRVSWEAGATVTHLLVHQVGDDDNLNDQTISLDATAIAAGEYTVTGLASATSYTITLWNGLSKRGSVNAATGAAMPSADYEKVLDATETLIDGDMLAAFAAQAATDGKTEYGVTIGIPAGATVDFHTVGSEGNSNVKIPDGMSITFFGKSGGEAPTIKFQKNIDLEGSHGYIAFENVNVVNDGANYFVNQSKACTVGEFRVKDATVSGFNTAFFRLQGGDVKNIGKLILDNSIFHDMCSGYSFIHVDASSGKGVVNNIEINNSTLYNIAANGKMFIYSRNTNMESISVKNTTFYNCIGANNFWVDFGSTSYGCSGTFEFVNCLFTKTPDEVTKNNRSSNTIIFSDCYKTNDFFKTFPDCGELAYSADDLFTDPAHGNLTMKKDVKCGDPRWYME